MERNSRILDQIRQNAKLVVSDDFEIAVIERETKRHDYVNGVQSESITKKQCWATLRLLQRKAPGISSVSGDSKESFQTLIENASRAADASKVDPWFRLPLWRSQVLQARMEIEDLSPEQEGAALRSLYQGLARKPYAFCESYEVESEKVTLFRKHDKNLLSRGRRAFRTNIGLTLNENPDWFRYEGESPVFSVDQRREQLVELLGGALQLSSAGTFNGSLGRRFILGPQVVAFLLEENEEQFLATTYQRKNILESGVSPVLSFIDDGTMKEMPGSAIFDYEGSLAERTVLLEKGVFKTLLHNNQTATKENRLSTGNFVLKEDQRLPQSGFTNFYVDRGECSDLISELGEGFYLQKVEAAERRPELATRLWASGFRVAKGKLVEPVRRIPLAISISDLLCGAQSVGQDLEFFGNIGSPSILIEKNP